MGNIFSAGGNFPMDSNGGVLSVTQAKVKGLYHPYGYTKWWIFYIWILLMLSMFSSYIYLIVWVNKESS